MISLVGAPPPAAGWSSGETEYLHVLRAAAENAENRPSLAWVQAARPCGPLLVPLDLPPEQADFARRAYDAQASSAPYVRRRRRQRCCFPYHRRLFPGGAEGPDPRPFTKGRRALAHWLLTIGAGEYSLGDPTPLVKGRADPLETGVRNFLGGPDNLKEAMRLGDPQPFFYHSGGTGLAIVGNFAEIVREYYSRPERRQRPPSAWST